jgi:hypothetical protein
MKRLQKAQEEKATTKKPDGAALSFKEKVRLFAVEASESTPKAQVLEGPARDRRVGQAADDIFLHTSFT